MVCPFVFISHIAPPNRSRVDALPTRPGPARAHLTGSGGRSVPAGPRAPDHRRAGAAALLPGRPAGGPGRPVAPAERVLRARGATARRAAPVRAGAAAQGRPRAAPQALAGRRAVRRVTARGASVESVGHRGVGVKDSPRAVSCCWF